MDVEVFWDDAEETIIRQTLKGSLSPEQYYAAMEYLADLLEELHDAVDVIIQFESYDASRSYSFLSGMLSHLTAGLPNANIMAIVVPRRIRAHLDHQVINKMTVSHCALVDNLNHAYTLIESHRQHTNASV